VIDKILEGKACPLCWLQSYEVIIDHPCQFDIEYVLTKEMQMNTQSPEEIKLAGNEQNMLRGRFREIFNSGAGHLTKRINKIIKDCPQGCESATKLCKEHTGIVIPMIDQWIVKLTEASFTPKVLAQSARVFRDDITKNLSEKEAKAWQVRSREYVVKEPVDAKTKVVKAKKESKSIDPLALIAALKEQGLTKEQIKEKLGL